MVVAHVLYHSETTVILQICRLSLQDTIFSLLLYQVVLYFNLTFVLGLVLGDCEKLLSTLTLFAMSTCARVTGDTFNAFLTLLSID